MCSNSEPRHPTPDQLSDTQLAEALAQAEAEAREAQTRTEALRSEGWRRRGRIDAKTQFPLTFFAFIAGYLISSGLLTLVRFGLGTFISSPFMLLPLVMLVVPVLMANFLLRKMEQAAPDKQGFRASVRDFWKLARKPALQGFLLGVGLGLFMQWLFSPS